MNTSDRPISKLRTLEYRVLMHFESLRLYWELIILVDRFIIRVCETCRSPTSNQGLIRHGPPFLNIM